MADITPTSGTSDATVAPIPSLIIEPAPAPLDPNAAPKEESTETKAAETEAPEKAAADDTSDEAERDPKTGRFAKREARIQERINELTSQKYQAQREVEQLIAKAQTLRRSLSTDPQIPADDWNAQETHRVRTAIKSETLEQTETAAREAIGRAEQLRTSTFMSKVDAASERIPDLHKVLEADFARLPLPVDAQDLIADSDKAAEIAYHLAKNPQKAFDLNRMSPAQQGRAIARIEAELTIAPQVRKTTQAPNPVPTLGGSRSPAVRDPADMSVEDLQKFLTPRLGRH